jgi:hypothetical protein
MSPPSKKSYYCTTLLANASARGLRATQMTLIVMHHSSHHRHFLGVSTMTITFDRPLGSPADLKELEYLSAISQTAPELRQDASIDGKSGKWQKFEERAYWSDYAPALLFLNHHRVASDIANLLLSRHGLLVDTEVVEQSILVDLCGEFDVDSPLYKMDLVQVVALLLIPHILKNGDEGKAMERVLAVLVSEVETPTLNREFLKQVLDFHGEVHVNDETLDAMIEVAGGQDTELTTTSLLRALTSDVTLYHTEWTDRLSTHYQDVFSSFRQGKRVKETSSTHNDEESPEDTEHPSVHEENIMDGLKTEMKKLATSKHEETSSSALSLDKPPPLRKIYTASAIDQVADTYSSQSFTVILWASMIIVYLAYFWNFDL